VSQYVVLEANPHYFEGAPKLVRYVYRIIPDQAVQFLEMRAQGLDSVTLSPDQYLAYDAMYENHVRYQYPSNQYTYLAFNLKKPLFQDARVRQAFALAIDKQKLVDGLLLGKGQAITGPYPTSSWAYNKEVPVTP
jgi:peptide/nickel transport system substrate-binding protein